MSFDLQLANRRALVTGGTKGVGEAVVTRLRNAGVKVLTTARSRGGHSGDEQLPFHRAHALSLSTAGQSTKLE